MIVIRDAQMQALRQAKVASYNAAIASYLRDHTPEQVAHLDDAALRAWVGEALARAQRHGLEIEWDLCRFARLEALVGPRFDERLPWAARFFSRTDLDPTQKISAAVLYHRTYLGNASHG